jgi:hypothetical protein
MEQPAPFQDFEQIEGFGHAAPGYSDNAPRIQKLRYSHQAMIDMIIANPMIKQGEIAAAFGMTQAWISQIINSDAFQAALATRRAELINPVLVQSIEERLRGLAHQAATVVAEKLEATQNPDLAIKALEISAKALGFGARGAPGSQTNVQNNFVVHIPAKQASAEEWAAAHARPAIPAKPEG